LPTVSSEPLSHDDEYALQGRSVVVLILRTGWPSQIAVIHDSHPLPRQDIHTAR
jgi:hypothetical protein